MIIKSINKSISYLAWLLIPSLSFAFEITVIDPGPLAKRGISVKKINASDVIYPRATAADVECGKKHHMTRFRLNDKHAGLPFSISAKKMTRIKIHWDHSDKVLFPDSEKKKTIVFPHAGGVSRFYFRSHYPISGNLYIMNDQNIIIKTCPYSFLPAKKFRQSVNVSVNDTEYERVNEELDNGSNNISVNYRISSKNIVPEGNYWSLSVGVSKSESSTNSRRVNGSFSYNW